MRIGLVLALVVGLPLAACACDGGRKSVVETTAPARVAPVAGEARYDLSAVRQVNSIRWNRPGSWTPVKLDAHDPREAIGLLARDRVGDRILVASPSAGYRVSQVRLDCAHGGLVPLGTKAAVNDADAVDPKAADARSPFPVTRPGEVTRICRGAPPVTEGTPSESVSMLRDAALRSLTPAAPSAEERARLYREYMASQKSGKGSKAP